MSSPDRAWGYVVFSWVERLFRPVRRLLAIASPKPRRAPPAVPPKLRELLKDYPEHIERLQEVLKGSFE